MAAEEATGDGRQSIKRAGMEGAALSATARDVRTAGVSAANDEDRDERTESRARGLPRAAAASG